MSETYTCPEGFSGVYRMLVRRVWGDVTAGKVTIDIYTNRFTPQERHIRKQIPLSDKDALVIFDIPEGSTQSCVVRQAGHASCEHQGCSKPSRPHSAAESSLRIGSGHKPAVARSRGLNNGFVPFFRNRGAVGFRPELTMLPEGANLISATAVISADRRYVRFSGLPFFSTIGEVQTFNFATGDTGTDGGGLGGGGLGGGGLGGGF